MEATIASDIIKAADMDSEPAQKSNSRLLRSCRNLAGRNAIGSPSVFFGSDISLVLTPKATSGQIAKG